MYGCPALLWMSPTFLDSSRHVDDKSKKANQNRG